MIFENSKTDNINSDGDINTRKIRDGQPRNMDKLVAEGLNRQNKGTGKNTERKPDVERELE
jgi:hypothetical protein